MVPSFVAFDLDGTVFSHPLHPIMSPRVAQALQRAHDLGSQVVVVSGRPWPMLGRSLLDFEALDWRVNLNGAAVTDRHNRFVFTRPMAPDLVRSAIAQGQGHGEGWCLFLKDGSYFERRQRDYLVGGGADVGDGPRPDEPLTSAEGPMVQSWAVDSIAPHLDFSREVLKLSVSLPAGDPYLDDLQALYEARGDLEVAPMDGISLELTAKGVDKGTTLELLCDRLGLDPARGVCFGDGANDLPLCGHPWTFVAMGNAVEELKAAADDHTAPVTEDGVALWLESHLG